MADRTRGPFGTVTVAFTDWWREWVRMAALNLAWVIACLTVVLAPPATLVLYWAVRELQHGRDVGPGEVVRAGRRFFLRSWAWFLPNGLVALLVLANVTYYGRLPQPFAVAMFLLLTVAVVLWLAVQFYVPAFLMVQERPALVQAYRNAFLTSLASPLYTLILSTAASLVILVSLRFLPILFLGGMCLVAMLSTHAVANRLERFGLSAPSGTPRGATADHRRDASDAPADGQRGAPAGTGSDDRR